MTEVDGASKQVVKGKCMDLKGLTVAECGMCGAETSREPLCCACNDEDVRATERTLAELARMRAAPSVLGHARAILWRLRFSAAEYNLSAALAREEHQGRAMKPKRAELTDAQRAYHDQQLAKYLADEVLLRRDARYHATSGNHARSEDCRRQAEQAAAAAEEHNFPEAEGWSRESSKRILDAVIDGLCSRRSGR